MAARVLLLVVVLGLWEGLSRAGVIDPFNFSMPSKIWDQIWVWVTHGTALGSLGEQIWYTLYEALLGWGIGVVAGVLLGIALGGSDCSPRSSVRTSRCSTRFPGSSWRPSS